MIALQILMEDEKTVEMIFRGTQNWPTGENISPITLLIQLTQEYPVRGMRIIKRKIKKQRGKTHGWHRQTREEIELEKLLWLNALNLVGLLNNLDAGKTIFYQGKKLSADDLYWFATEGIITGFHEFADGIYMEGGYFH